MSEERIKLGASFDPSMIRDDQWTYRGLSSNGFHYVWTYHDPVLDITIEKKQPIEAEKIIRQNQERYNDSHGKRWGDGRVVASIPLNVFFDQFKGRHNDPEFTDWFLNNDENRVWRNFKGNV